MTDAVAEHDRDLHEMHVVDEPGGEEVAYDGRAAADPDVLALGRSTGGLERLGRGSVEEVERRAPLHLERGPGVVSEHEGRRVERRVRTPPALPVRVVLPAGWAELVGAHDLGADARAEARSEGVVDSDGPARPPVPGAEHPLVETVTRMAEGCVERLRLTGGEAVERDGKVVDPAQRHPHAPGWVGGCASGSVHGGSVDQLLGAAVEGTLLDQLQIEVCRALENRAKSGLAGDVAAIRERQ